MILVSLENVKKYSHVVARLPQRLKSTLFEIFSILQVPLGHPPFEKISNNVDFSLWGKQCICPTKMRPKLWKSHIVRRWCWCSRVPTYNTYLDIYSLMTQFAILEINRGWDVYCVCEVSSVIIRDHPHNKKIMFVCRI